VLSLKSSIKGENDFCDFGINPAIMTSIKKRIRVVVKINSLETNHRFVNETVNTIRSRDKKLDQKMIRIVSQKEP
jgi:hypothetical protein